MITKQENNPDRKRDARDFQPSPVNEKVSQEMAQDSAPLPDVFIL